MSHDVERLAKVLYEGMPCPLGRWEDLSDAVRGTWFAIARSAMKAGVTLPTPPRATPLEAAAAKLRELDDANGPVWPDYEKPAAEVIAAAVGALSDEDVRQIGQAYVSTPYRTRAADRTRAALLARLTEGGTA